MTFRRALVCVAIATTVLSIGIAEQAQAQPAVPQSQVVSAVPSTATPNLDGGIDYAITQVGTTIVTGGTFTSATSPGTTTPLARTGIVAFDQSTGTVSASFDPTLDGLVDALIPGPTPGTVYVGGQFKTVNGVKSKGITLLNVSDGSIVAGFKPPALNGIVEAMRLSGGRLYLTGTFTATTGFPHGGLATLNPTTGAVDPFMAVQLTGHHNYTGQSNQANGPVGGRAMDISPDGTRAVIVGDFKYADGVVHDQIVMLDLTGSTAAVDAAWNTNEFTAACSSGSFDTYVTDVAFAPDSSYFSVSATGGGGISKNPDGTRSLCDSVSRWSTTDTGTTVQPTWVDYAGNDTFWSVAVTGTAVYAGGHARWINNPNGSDKAAAGAVPRPGIVALDPVSGLPLTWNPGRNPRGAGAYALLATDQGLYVGSDTDYIGDYKYKRDEIAFFPLAGGYTPAPTTTDALPGNVYETGPTNSTGAGANDLAYRSYSPSAIGAQTVLPGTGVSWSTARGAFAVGSSIFFGTTGASFYRAAFNGTTVGTPVAVDPYDDPAWSSVATGSGGTYQGSKSGYYAELPSVTGAFYSDGRLYYTLAGRSSLYWRYFSPDSGTIGGQEFTVAANLTSVAGMFASGTTIYYANSGNGTLHALAYSDGGTNGLNPSVDSSSDHVVSGPSVDGRDWRSRGMFVYNIPTAAATASCTNLTCTFDGSTSSDPDGAVGSYAWTFGDGTTGTGVNPSHGYASAGTYTYTLVVTDSQGATSPSFSGTVTATASAAPPITFAGSTHSYSTAATVASGASVGAPATVTTGDTELLFVSTPVVGAAGVPSGWTQIAQQTAAPLQVTVFQHTATAADAGATVRVPITATSAVAVQLVDYRDVGSAAIIATGAGDTSTATHVAPAATVPASGSWVLSYWTDKSSTTTAWTLPATVTSRDVVIGTGGGRTTGAVADSGAPVATGAYPSRTATVTGGASGKGAMLSLVLAPQS